MCYGDYLLLNSTAFLKFYRTTRVGCPLSRLECMLRFEEVGGKRLPLDGVNGYIGVLY